MPKLKPTHIAVTDAEAAVTKERITIRLSPDAVKHFRATGDGWQTRMDAALPQFIAEHPLAR